MPAVIPIIGAAATIGGAALSSGATSNAASTQAAEQQAALNQQQAQFNQTQQNIAPWLAAGTNALGQQMNLLGIGTGGAQGQQSAIDQLQQSPMYQSLYRNGQNAVLNNAAATGGLRGGNTQNSLANFGSDTLAQVIQAQLANLGGISNTGNASATNLGNQSQANANAQSQQYNAIGQSQAGGILGQAGIWNNAFNSLGKQLGTLQTSSYGVPASSYGLTDPTASIAQNAGTTIASNPSIF